MHSSVWSWLTVGASENGLSVIIYEQRGLWCAALWSENNKTKTLVFRRSSRKRPNRFSGDSLGESCGEKHAYNVSRTLHSSAVSSALSNFHPCVLSETMYLRSRCMLQHWH